MWYYFFRALPALAHRNYQWWFTGQSISLIGTWIQMVAQGWLVLQLTNSAFWVGAIAALNSLPVLFLTLFGGVIVDRFPKKTILFVCEFFAMLLAFSLGILTVFEAITIYHVAVLAFLLGVVTALDMPARLAFAKELVDKEDLSSALALNAGTFNGARVIGPAVAGYLIATIGIGGGFMVNGLSFLAILIALLFIKTTPEKHDVHPKALEAIAEGVRYSMSHSLIKSLLILTGILSIFGWAYIVIMPVVIKDVFHLGATELGYFNSVAGVGALLGSVIVSALSKKIDPWTFILSGGFMFSIAVIIFSLTTHIPLALFALFFMGLGLIFQFATINATIQHNVEDNFRGRVMSIYTFMFIGLTPLGSIEIGTLSEHFGSQFALRISGIVVFLVCCYYLYRKNTIAKAV